MSEFDAKEANLGLKGGGQLPHFYLGYNLMAQYSNNLDDIEVRNAYAFLTAAPGTLFVGKSASGSYQDVYSHVDIHPNLNAHGTGKQAPLHEQGKWADNTLGYASPWWHSGAGDLQLKTSVTPMESKSGNHGDVWMGRINYRYDNIEAVLNYLNMAGDIGDQDETYHRTAMTLRGQFDAVKLVALAELTNNSFSHAQNTYVASASYQQDRWLWGISHQYKTFEDEQRFPALGLTIASVRYQYWQDLSFYVEGAVYSDDPADYVDFSKDRFAHAGNSLALGMLFSF